MEEIKQRLAIEDVVSEYVQLKRAGRNYKGLSPFNAEKTPSFIVSPEKGIWHDFSSGKGGDMLSFVMEMEGLDFKAALELLARKAGVDLAQYQSSHSAENGKLKERLYDAVEQTARFYQVQFSKNHTALEYILKERRFSKEIALSFRIGYAPNNGTALIDYLKKQGFLEPEIQKAGLATKRYRGLSDMFYGRIMIPLQDAQGRIIGFTARQLDDDPDAPKYINTPQTLIYDKGRHVYGLHLAKEAIRKLGYVVVVEGNLDVIAAHQAGTAQVVATAGTALTEMHLKAINRFTSDVRLAFDQDKAGLAATERSIGVASKVGVSLSILTIPSGKDPDELIKNDPKAWERTLEKPQYALDWLIERYQNQLDLGSAVGKRQFSDILLGVIRQLNDKVEQDHYVQRLAETIGVSADAMRSKLSQTGQITTRLKKRKAETLDNPKEHLEIIKFQDHLLALLLVQLPLRFYLKALHKDMLLSDVAKKLWQFLSDNPDFSGDLKEAEGLREIADYTKILSLQYEELYQGLELLELRNEAARLQTRLIEHYVKSKKQKLALAMHDATDSEQGELLQEAKELDKLLKSH